MANAHIDPVWLWDIREGLNEGIQTCHTVCNLLEADPELTFIREESAIYEHIERTSPVLFDRIRTFVNAGRWDIVGATFVQPDTNLSATETLLRHFLRGQTYFQSRFGVRPRVAWSADSFGHASGLPDILAAAGMDGFAFTRPSAEQLPLSQPAFWWQGSGGARILSYRPSFGWYGTERDELPRRLDASLADAAGNGLVNIGVFFGVGNHGGGPTRRQIADIRAWAAAHPEVQVIFSGLHRFFDALHVEVSTKGEDCLPTHAGELGFCLRGCYVSAAKVKFPYRKTEALVSRAETTDTVIASTLGHAPADLSASWDAVLLNSFHDILPGTSIERALDEQIDQMAGARYTARTTEFMALSKLAQSVDTTVPAPPGDYPAAVPIFLWNPHPFPFLGPIALEVCLDGRSLLAYWGHADDVPLEVRSPEGDAIPFQRVDTEHHYNPGLPFRARVIVSASVPPTGWSVYTIGWVEGAKTLSQAAGAYASAPDTIANEQYSVKATVGGTGVVFMRNGRPFMGKGGLSVVTVEDPYGTWGDMNEDPVSLDLSSVRETWTVKNVQILEQGPARAKLWVRLTGGNSWLDLTFSLLRGGAAIDVDARLLWNERAARLKLVMPIDGEGKITGSAEFEVPGGTARRGPLGEVPGGRWVHTDTFGFASDSLYGFDLKSDHLQVSVCRTTRYASDAALGPAEDLWRPALDTGEFTFRFLLTGYKADLRHQSRLLEQPLVVLPVPASAGTRPRTGSLAALEPGTLTLLACKPAADTNGFVLRVQGGQTDQDAILTWQGQMLSLGQVRAGEIVTWHIKRGATGWQGEKINAVEENFHEAE